MMTNARRGAKTAATLARTGPSIAARGLAGGQALRIDWRQPVPIGVCGTRRHALRLGTQRGEGPAL